MAGYTCKQLTCSRRFCSVCCVFRQAYGRRRKFAGPCQLDDERIAWQGEREVASDTQIMRSMKLCLAF